MVALMEPQLAHVAGTHITALAKISVADTLVILAVLMG